MKIIIAGGRELLNYQLVRDSCEEILKEIEGPHTIISGKSAGADLLGEVYAAEKGWEVVPFFAKWGTEGRRAGPIRNEQMAKFAAPDGMLIAFWNGVSKGTRSMINEAKKQNLIIHVIRY